MKILITVKTYPTISEVHKDEFVCTAGFNENGDWVRLYPIPFRSLDYVSQYKKYDWIEVNVKKHKSDWRPESYSPVNLENAPIRIVGHLRTKNNWEERKAIVLKKVYTDLTELIEDSKENGKKISLAVFKPTVINNFIFSEEERKWDEKKIGWLKQQNLFEDMTKRNVIRKLPYKFSYVFKDINGTSSTLMVEDWELGQLFWKQLENKQDEKIACQDVKNKYLDQLCSKTDLHFFLGTNYIHLLSDRMSCSRFEANQFRLFMYSAAYILLHALCEKMLQGTEYANATMKTRIKIELPKQFPDMEVVANCLGKFNGLRC